MASHFGSLLDEDRPISTSRALVAYGCIPPDPEMTRPFADAAFLTTLIAVRARTESARARRRADPLCARDRYRAGGALGGEPNLFVLKTL